MNVVILCAGFATRMYPLTQNFPKPLLKVADKPVLDYLMEQIITFPEVQAVHIVSNGKFYDHFSEWQRHREVNGVFGDTPIHVHNDGCFDNKSRLGAAGDLLLALRKIEKPGRIMVSGGDNIYRFPLKPLCEKFLQHADHHIVALVETELEKLQKTGVLEIESDNRVIRLHEKPQAPPSTFTCPPLYFFQPEFQPILEKFLETPGNHDAPGYFIDYLCGQSTVRAFIPNSTRLDIGSVQTYQEADEQLRVEPLFLDQNDH